MKRVYIKGRHTIYKSETRDREYLVTKNTFLGRYKWDGWIFTSLEVAIMSISNPKSSQGSYKYKLPKR